jgi:hypothetical protein
MAGRRSSTEVHAVFRKKTRGQVIGAELQEGFSHLGTAVAEASRAVAEELAPRVEAAQKAAAPRIEAAQKAVSPKVAAAVAAAAPVVASARDTVAPRVEAAREVLGPRVEAAREAAAPRVEAARLAAVKAAADLGPRVEAARETLQKDVVPKLAATQAAAVAYAAPKVLAAREAVVAAAEQAQRELEARRDELVASTADARKKAKKKAAKQRKELEKKAAKTATKVKRKVGVEKEPRRWPWLLGVVVVGGVVFAVLRRLRGSQDSWTPAPAGDGPVPSYREDPVPSDSSSNSGRTVSAAETAPGDATPPDDDLGTQINQPVGGPDDENRGDVPEPGSVRPADPKLSATTAGPDLPVPEGPGGVDPRSDATNPTDSPTGPAGTPLADRGEEPEKNA